MKLGSRHRAKLSARSLRGKREAPPARAAAIPLRLGKLMPTTWPAARITPRAHTTVAAATFSSFDETDASPWPPIRRGKDFGDLAH